MIDLRDYQQECVDNVRTALGRSRRVLLQAPTGAGKTRMAAHMQDNAHAKGVRSWFICHRRELVEQTAKTFRDFDMPFGFIAAGFAPNPYQPIQICSIDTLKNRIGKVQPPGLILWDEAHHVGAAGWAKVQGHFDRAYHIGLSATPQRLDGKGLDAHFDELVPGPQVAELIERGYLARYKLYSVPGADLSAVHTKMGDFVKGESAAAMDKPSIVGDIVAHWVKYAQGRKTIGFAVTRQHSEHMAAAFNAAGIPAAHLDGETEKGERRRTLQALAAGEIQVVWNVGLFGEGFDIAANSGMDVTIGCVIDAAPTRALGAWLQRCGRALRPQTDYAIILDHSGNLGRHGLPCQQREWTLEGRARTGRKSDDEAEVRVKQCEKCFFVYPSGNVCPECGHVHEVQGRKLEEVAGELQEVDTEASRAAIRQQMGQARTLDQLKDLEKQQGKKPGWAEHVHKAREEKAMLRRTLHNLVVGANQAGMPISVNMQEMKPKELKERIADIESRLTLLGLLERARQAGVPVEPIEIMAMKTPELKPMTDEIKKRIERCL